MTYAQLITNIGEWINRRNGELDTVIQQQIIESQAALEKKFKLWFLLDEFVAHLPAGSVSTKLPWHIIKIFDAEIRDSNNQKYDVQITSPARLRDQYPDVAATTPQTGTPEILSFMGHVIHFGRQADVLYHLRLKAHHHLAKLDLATNPSNIWTEEPPYLTALRFNTLIALESFIQDDERLIVWKAQRDEILEDLAAESMQGDAVNMQEAITEDLY